MVQPYVFKFKEKATVTKGEQDSVVALEKPSIAIEDQPGVGSSSFADVQSFFRAKLRTIKEKKV